MTIRVGDKTIWLEQNYRGAGRPCLISRSDSGEIQVLMAFAPPADSTTGLWTIRLLKNYAFTFLDSKGKLLLESFSTE